MRFHLLGLATLILCSVANAAPTSRPSLVDLGDTSRLTAVFAKAERGEPITVACIGGSITQGYAASRPENNYASRIAAWWRKELPKSEVTLINAGIGATGSAYGCLRVQRDVLAKRPDFVVVEFSVNDANTREDAETYEGTIRQILGAPSQPACLLLFMTQENHTSAQEFDEKIGRHYRLPMASYRDGVFSMLDAREIQWRDISPDNIHPNDRGMELAAKFVTDLLAQCRTIPAAAAGHPEKLPSPLFTDLYARTWLAEGADLKPLSNTGWSFDDKEQCWTSSTPGSVIEFESLGRALTVMFHRFHKDFGQVDVAVDGGPPQVLDGWFDQTWGGKKELVQIARDLDFDKPHRVRITLREQTAPESHGHEFRILGLGVAGAK